MLRRESLKKRKANNMLIGSIDIHKASFSDECKKCHLDASFFGGKKTLVFYTGGFGTKKYGFSDIASVEIASEDNTKTLGTTLIRGAIGGIMLGGLGLLAGALTGGKNDVTFICTLKDGSKFLGTTKKKTFTLLQAECF